MERRKYHPLNIPHIDMVTVSGAMRDKEIRVRVRVRANALEASWGSTRRSLV